MEPLNIKPPSFLPLSSDVKESLQKQDPTLKETAQQFESLLIVELLREMEKTLEEGSIFGGGIEGDIYGDLVRWELAKNISSSSQLGIADAMVRQLSSPSELSSKVDEETQ